MLLVLAELAELVELVRFMLVLLMCRATQGCSISLAFTFAPSPHPPEEEHALQVLPTSGQPRGCRGCPSPWPLGSPRSLSLEGSGNWGLVWICPTCRRASLGAGQGQAGGGCVSHPPRARPPSRCHGYPARQRPSGGCGWDSGCATPTPRICC